MKTAFAIVAIAAATFSLQPLVAAKSSPSNPQSVLDPLAIQEETQKKLVQQKHLKSSKRKNSSKYKDSLGLGNGTGYGNNTGHNNGTSVSERRQRSQLAEAFDYDPGSLKTYQKVARLRAKTVRANAKQKSPRKGVAQSKLNNTKTAAVSNKKNIFESGAEAAGKIVTAPVRGLHALFKPKQSN